MRDILIGLIGGLVLGIIGTYVVTQSGLVPTKIATTPNSKTAQPTPAGFKPDTNLPYPLNLPAFSNTTVTYSLNATITEIKPDPQDSTATDLRVQSIFGPKFPDVIIIPATLNASPLATSSATPKVAAKPASKLVVGERVVVDLSYSPKTGKLVPSSLYFAAQ
jgi:hypothetical protein